MGASRRSAYLDLSVDSSRSEISRYHDRYFTISEALKVLLALEKRKEEKEEEGGKGEKEQEGGGGGGSTLRPVRSLVTKVALYFFLSNIL